MGSLSTGSGQARRARREVWRDEDLNVEVGTRNLELFAVIRTNGLNSLPFTT
jgi:hypothetical protein